MNTTVREITAEDRFGGSILKKGFEIFSRRELLLNLIRKELKVRYKNSFLGFLWSMLNPLFYLLVFYVVFSVFLPGGIPKFHVYLLAGLLPWTLFTSSLLQATGSVTSNAGLVKKVYFPREMLPLSAIGAGIFHFLLQLIVLAGFLVVTQYPFAGKAVALIPLALLVEVILLWGLSFLFASVNVKARDVQYFLEIALLAWFWMTPIIYPSAMVADRLANKSFLGMPLLGIYLANPMARIALAFQRGIYGAQAVADDGQLTRVLIDAPLSWFAEGLIYAFLGGVLLVLFGWWVFHKLDGGFAEEL